jgi:hypothetical protein
VIPLFDYTNEEIVLTCLPSARLIIAHVAPARYRYNAALCSADNNWTSTRFGIDLVSRRHENNQPLPHAPVEYATADSWGDYSSFASCCPRKTSETANGLSMISWSTIGTASAKMARPSAPSV